MSRLDEYIAAHQDDPARDLSHYGVPGMKWGVTRSRKERAAAKTATPPKKADPPKDPEKQVVGAASGETSSSRYARLQNEIKSGGGNKLSEQDLKFFNARTDALAKVAKITEENPSWLRATATTVVQKSAQRQMQMITDTIADKYIGKPIAEALKTPVAKPDDD